MSKKSLIIDEIETPSSLKEKYDSSEKLKSDLYLTREKWKDIKLDSDKINKNRSGFNDNPKAIGLSMLMTLLVFAIIFGFLSDTPWVVFIPVSLLIWSTYKFVDIYNTDINIDSKIKLNNNIRVGLFKKIEEFEKGLEILEQEINLEELKYLTNLVQNIKSHLDSDNDNTIDIIQHDNEFMKILKSNQKVVLEFEKSENRDFTKQFVKLSSFLVEKESNLQKIYLRVSDINQLEFFENFKENLLNQIHFYNVLRINSLQMLSSFVDDDRITFYIIYEKFDKLGVWNTNFENQLLFKIDLLNSNINSLISEFNNMSDSINNSISELISITEENTSSLSKKLGEIGSKLDTSNILNTINTYQNYKTNKRLR